MSQTLEFKVEGAGCGSCVKAIEGALNAVQGVSKAKFDLASATATVETELTADQIVGIIDEAGYDAALKA